MQKSPAHARKDSMERVEPLYTGRHINSEAGSATQSIHPRSARPSFIDRIPKILTALACDPPNDMKSEPDQRRISAATVLLICGIPILKIIKELSMAHVSSSSFDPHSVIDAHTPTNPAGNTEAAQNIIAPTQEQVERSEEHTSELQSRFDLVCRLL